MIAAGLLAASLAALPAPSDEPGAKRALLIGVQYQDDRLKLNTAKDVELVSTMLKGDRYGFPAENVTVSATPESTTREGLMKSFETLVGQTKEGDIIYVQYSGHGDQVPDRDGDEADGYDETLVPSNVSASGDNQVTDDEVGRFIDQLMLKKPASVTIIFDCCHSGTIARGPKARKIPSGFWSNRPTAAASEQREVTGGMLPSGERSTKLVVMSAARSDQPAFETSKGDAMGAFSYGLVKALTNPEVGPTTTARELFDRVCQYVKEQNQLQVPMIEGELDMEFLGGEVRPSQPYLPVEWRSGNIVVPAGSFQGLTEGSEFEVHRAGTTSPTEATKLAVGGLKAPSAFESEISLIDIDAAKVAELSAMSGLRAFETKRAAPDNGIRLAIDQTVQKESTWTAVETSLKSFPLVIGMNYVPTTADKMPDGDYSVLIESTKPGSVRLMRKDGTPLSTSEFDLTAPGSERQLQEALNNESRWQFLYAMRNTATNSGVKMMLRVVPVEVQPDPRNPQNVVWVRDREAPLQNSGEVQIRKSDYFRLEVKNTGTQDAYVNILSMESTGKVGLVFPDSGDTQANAAFAPCAPDDATAPDRGWTKLENADGTGGKAPIVWQMSPDKGLEVFKLLATLDKVRAEPFLTPATARGTRGNGSFLEEFLKASTLGQRTNRVSRGAVKDWWADQLNIRITD